MVCPKKSIREPTTILKTILAIVCDHQAFIVCKSWEDPLKNGRDLRKSIRRDFLGGYDCHIFVDTVLRRIVRTATLLTALRYDADVSPVYIEVHDRFRKFENRPGAASARDLFLVFFFPFSGVVVFAELFDHTSGPDSEDVDVVKLLDPHEICKVVTPNETIWGTNTERRGLRQDRAVDIAHPLLTDVTSTPARVRRYSDVMGF